MSTRQTIASPKPANIKISSPIPKKISRIFGHIFPKISRIPLKIARSLQICSKRNK